MYLYPDGRTDVRTNGRTDERTDKGKLICPPTLCRGGIKTEREGGDEELKANFNLF